MKNYNLNLRLIDTYGKLLSPKKLSYIEDYYYDDMSLSEISEKYNVSRSAIHEAINYGMKELHEYEQKMCYIKKQDKRIEFIKSKLEESDFENYLNLELGAK